MDDNGVGKDKLSEITADLFADDLEREPPETFARVSRGLLNLEEAGRIVRYSHPRGNFLAIVNWEEHQRIDKPGKPRFPSPDADLSSIRETVVPGTGEQGNRGTEEQGNRGTARVPARAVASAPSASDEAFAEFWDAYPRKEAKQAARKAWVKAVKIADPQTIIDGAARFACDVNRDPAYTAHPATWLNAGRWEDEPLPPRGGQSPQLSRNAQRAQDGLELAEMYEQMEGQLEGQEVAFELDGDGTFVVEGGPY